MKKKDLVQAREKSVSELQEQVNTLEMSLKKAQLELKSHKLPDVKKVGKLADELAQLQTIITEKSRQLPAAK